MDSLQHFFSQFVKNTDNEALYPILACLSKSNPKATMDALVIWRKNNSTSNALLCRLLIEILSQLTTLDTEQGNKLLDMTLSQLQTDTLGVFGELLGALSRLKFVPLPADATEEVVHQFRFLHLLLYPQQSLDLTTRYLGMLQEAFQNASALKHVVAATIDRVLEPLGQDVVAEVNLPLWTKNVEALYQKAMKLAQKPRYYHVAYPLICSIMGVTKKDLFHSRAPQLQEQVLKLKDKHLRMFCTLKLLWIYLYRCMDSISSAQKKCDQLLKLLFAGKKVEYEFTRFVVIAGCKLPDFVVKNVFQPALDSPIMFEIVQPERMLCLLRSLTILYTAPDQTKPSFVFESEPSPTGVKRIHDDHVIEEFDENVYARLQTKFKPNKKFADTVEKCAQYYWKVIQVIDQHFGKLLLIDDRFAIRGTTGSSSQQASASAQSELTAVLSKEKQPYFELITDWLMSLPAMKPVDQCLELVVRYTVHVDPEIGSAAVQCLLRYMSCEDLTSDADKSVRKHLVTSIYFKFLYAIPDRFQDVQEKALTLYTQLWSIWFNAEVTAQQGSQVLWDRFGELEKIALVFMCSSNIQLRIKSFQIFKVSSQFHDTFLKDGGAAHIGSTQVRTKYLYSTLTKIGKQVIESRDNDFVQLPQSQLDVRENDLVLFDLMTSDAAADKSTWILLFPSIIQNLFKSCPTVVYEAMSEISIRLQALQQLVSTAADPSKSQTSTLTSKFSYRSYVAATDDQIMQWSFYLQYVSVCITTSDPQWKASKAQHAGISTVQEVLSLSLPLLQSEKSSIRVAVATSLGHLNPQVFKDLLEDLKPALKGIIDDMRNRYLRASTRRVKRLEKLRIELTNILALSVHSIRTYLHDENVLGTLLTYIRETGAFLSDPEVQTEWDHQMFRFYFCQLVQNFFQNTDFKLFPFDLRLSLFELLEEWSGFGPKGQLMKDRESKMILSVLEHVKDIRERGALTNVMDEQRRALEYVAVDAMQVLVTGSLDKDEKRTSSLSMMQLFDWIDAVITSNDLRHRALGVKALVNLVSANINEELLWVEVVSACYEGKFGSVLSAAYFKAVVMNVSKANIPVTQLVTLSLYYLWHPLYLVRCLAVDLLDILSQKNHIKFQRTLAATGSENDGQTAFRQIARNISAQISLQLQTQTLDVLYEMYYRADQLDSQGRTSMFELALPWISQVNLTPLLMEKPNGATMACKDFLGNLCYVSYKYIVETETSVANLWQQLCTTPANVHAVVQYLLQSTMVKRNTAYTLMIRSIVAILGRGPSSEVLCQDLLNELIPKHMVPSKKTQKKTDSVASHANFLAIALDELLPVDAKKPVFSKGGLVTIFLYDFVNERVELLHQHIPLILLVCLSQMDISQTLVRQFSIQMLLSFISQFGTQNESVKDAEAHIRSFLNYQSEQKSIKISHPEKLDRIVSLLPNMFASLDMDFVQVLGEVSIKWATQCPVRHIACRALEMYKHLRPTFTQKMMADLVSRLSNTICDQGKEVENFAYEIMVTMEGIVVQFDSHKLLLFPQIFWSMVLCMSTSYPDEYASACRIVVTYLTLLNLHDKSHRNVILAHAPSHYSGQSLVSILSQLALKGFSSVVTSSDSYKLMKCLIKCGHKNDYKDLQVVTNINLAFASRLALCLDDVAEYQDGYEVAIQISKAFEQAGHPQLGKLYDVFANKKFRVKDDFLKQLAMISRENLMPKFELDIITQLLVQLRVEDKILQRKTTVIFESFLSVLSKSDNKLPLVNSALFVPFYDVVQSDSSGKYVDLLTLLYDLTPNQQVKLHVPSAKPVKGATEVSDPVWYFSESVMKEIRQRLSAIAAAHQTTKLEPSKSINEIQQHSLAKHSSELSLDDHPVATRMYEVDYDHIYNQLDDLDDFFNDDMEYAESQEDIDYAVTSDESLNHPHKQPFQSQFSTDDEEDDNVSVTSKMTSATFALDVVGRKAVLEQLDYTLPPQLTTPLRNEESVAPLTVLQVADSFQTSLTPLNGVADLDKWIAGDISTFANVVNSIKDKLLISLREHLLQVSGKAEESHSKHIITMLKTVRLYELFVVHAPLEVDLINQQLRRYASLQSQVVSLKENHASVRSSPATSPTKMKQAWLSVSEINFHAEEAVVSEYYGKVGAVYQEMVGIVDSFYSDYGHAAEPDLLLVAPRKDTAMSTSSSVVTSQDDVAQEVQPDKPTRPNTFIEIMDGYRSDSTVDDSSVMKGIIDEMQVIQEDHSPVVYDSPVVNQDSPVAQVLQSLPTSPPPEAPKSD